MLEPKAPSEESQRWWHWYFLEVLCLTSRCPFHMYREQINVIALTLSNTVHSAWLVYSDIYLWFRVTLDQAPHFSACLELVHWLKWQRNQRWRIKSWIYLQHLYACSLKGTTWCLRCACVCDLGTTLKRNILAGRSQGFTALFNVHAIQARFRPRRNSYFMSGVGFYSYWPPKGWFWVNGELCDSFFFFFGWVSLDTHGWRNLKCPNYSDSSL